MSEVATAPESKPKLGLLEGWTEEVFSFMLLRIWIGLRLFLAGLEKFQGEDGFSLENYYEKMGRFVTYFTENTYLPGWMAKPYCYSLGYGLLLFGVLVLAGIKPKFSLTLSGLMFISLSFGLMVDNEASGIAWLAAHMVLTVMALLLCKHNRLAIFG